MLDLDEAVSRQGRQLLDRDGNKIGRIEQIYVDAQTGRPEWAVVSIGQSGEASRFAPLVDAIIADGELAVPFTCEQVEQAPALDGVGELVERDEQQLYRHYGYEQNPA